MILGVCEYWKGADNENGWMLEGVGGDRDENEGRNTMDILYGCETERIPGEGPIIGVVGNSHTLRPLLGCAPSLTLISSLLPPYLSGPLVLFIC